MRFAFLALVPAVLCAQPDLRLGAEVYARTCANQYCHGADGEQGAVGAIAGRGLRYSRVARSVIYGIAGTNMPPWKDALPQSELDAVIEYVLSLQGAATAPRPAKAPAQRPKARDHPGRDLFFDPGRVGSCGACHEFQGLGIAVAPSIARAPESAAALRLAAPSRLQTVTPASGEPFPGLAVETKGSGQRYYDLKPRLPVLRTVAKAGLRVRDGSDWTHAVALDRYSQEEQRTIVDYLHAALR